MFGKRKILKHGEQAEAVVVDAERSGYSNGHGIYKFHLKLRVKLDDGSIVDAACSAYPKDAAGAFMSGDVVPVRFDPKYPGDVELDTEAMAAAGAAVNDELKESAARLVRASEERLAKGGD
jgi:hypothetical protein